MCINNYYNIHLGSLPSLFVSLFINKKIHLFIVSECQIRWVRFREKFGKEKRQRELDLKNGNGISQRNIFTYYETMSFLNDHIKRRK